MALLIKGKGEKEGRRRGRKVEPKALAEIRELLGDTPRRRDLLIEFLHKIQDRHHCISAAHIVALAKEMNLSTTEIYEVATFYHHFDVVKEDDMPPPPLTVRVCDSVTCEMFGAKELIMDLQRRVGPQLRVKTAPCVGRCGGAPVAVVGTHALEWATPYSVEKAIAEKQTEAIPPAGIDYHDYVVRGGYKLLAACVNGERDVESVIKTLEDSNLRGLGGAGFPAGRKWRILRGQPKPRLVAINIDEGEPGTFKDRYYLERDPHRFLEGTLIAAWAIEAEEVYIYLRDEYAGCRTML
ncbi:MAG: NAD(P)H-dependent oxidoreductase subunit E, partial [Gammaproteobacteria bacterium]